MERKLATIERITEIHPIEGADAIERAVIRGWNIVIKKGEFKPGDLCVYCEIDSLMPEREEFEFLRPRGFRIKTIKLRGQISQGIIFPLEILYNGNADIPSLVHFVQEGLDVTEILGVTKWEPQIPAELSGTTKGGFPSHSIKTDEERIQNLIDKYEDYRRWYTWTATEKVDGSSVTYSIYNDEFEVASRNLSLKEHPENELNSFWKFARENQVEEKMRKFMNEFDMKALTIQGELIGEGIQKNKYRIKGQKVLFFRIFDPILYEFFPIGQAANAIEEMGLEFVPIIEDDVTLPDTVEKLLTYADGKSALHDTAREGVVFVAEYVFPGIDVETGESARPLLDYQGRLSFKVISNKFILKHDA